MTVLTDERAMRAERSENSAQVRRICFVCTGNTCRSPMAEAVASRLIADDPTLAGTKAFSAGLYANVGEPISPQAVLALEEAGIEPVATKHYRTHTAHNLSAEEAEQYDLLVGMTGAHAMELMMRFPALAQRIICMPTPISDPYGGDIAVYRACLAEIRDGVKALLNAEAES
jgi:protein-tyrosine-phosphatase